MIDWDEQDDLFHELVDDIRFYVFPQHNVEHVMEKVEEYADRRVAQALRIAADSFPIGAWAGDIRTLLAEAADRFDPDVETDEVA